MSPIFTLASLRNNQAVEIVDVDASSSLKERLEDFGFFPGIKLSFLRQAPFGGPMLVELMGSKVALRLCDANCVRVKAV